MKPWKIIDHSMVYKVYKIVPQFLIVLTFSITSLFATNVYSELYRYTNEQGTRVISDVISPQNVAKGYDIIDSRGNVIKTVPPEMTQAEKERLQNEVAEKARLQEWDKELNARYSTVEDIMAAKERRLSGIKNKISSLRLTLGNITQTIKHYHAEAAANERQGDVVAKETLSSIERLQNDKQFIEQEIKRQEKQKEKTEKSYNADIARFKLISKK